MTRESRNEMIVAALVVSALVHFGLMFFARSRVMTRIADGVARSPRHAPMEMKARSAPPPPVHIETVEDVKAVREAPEAEAVAAVPTMGAPDERLGKDAPAAPTPVPEAAAVAPVAERPVFEAKPLTDDRSMRELPQPPERTALPTAVPLTAPEVASSSAAAAPQPLPTVPASFGPSAAFGPAASAPTLTAKAPDAADFKPEDKVRERVDEKLVEREKAAVRELLDAEKPAELAKFANVAMTATVKDGWRYFRLWLSPRQSLPVVPKDVVILMDASGSIGPDRLRSVRAAAKGILRSCTNSGDRFNLVAFRDRYEYAFPAWQGCSNSSFERADAWLDEVAAHGRTDVFSSIRSVLTLPRNPQRPLIALVITDGEANVGVYETAEILSRFTALNDGLVSVYMYGVKNSANRELIDVLTRGNRGESFVYEGWLKGWSGKAIGSFAACFRDPVLSDLRLVFASASRAEAYPRRLRNLYRGGTVEVVGRVPADVKEVSFSVLGLNGADAYEGYFTLPFATAADAPDLPEVWAGERQIDLKLK